MTPEMMGRFLLGSGSVCQLSTFFALLHSGTLILFRIGFTKVCGNLSFTDSDLFLE